MTIGRFVQVGLIGASIGLVLISALAATNTVPGSFAEQDVSAISADATKPKPDCNGITVTVLVTGGSGGAGNDLVLGTSASTTRYAGTAATTASTAAAETTSCGAMLARTSASAVPARIRSTPPARHRFSRT